LFATTGFFAIAAGFAAKNIVENLMSGAILRFEESSNLRMLSSLAASRW